MSVTPVYSDSWPCQEGLKICHINMNHTINKIDEISHIYSPIICTFLVLASQD